MAANTDNGAYDSLRERMWERIGLPCEYDGKNLFTIALLEHSKNIVLSVKLSGHCRNTHVYNATWTNKTFEGTPDNILKQVTSLPNTCSLCLEPVIREIAGAATLHYDGDGLRWMYDQTELTEAPTPDRATETATHLHELRKALGVLQARQYENPSTRELAGMLEQQLETKIRQTTAHRNKNREQWQEEEKEEFLKEYGSGPTILDETPLLVVLNTYNLYHTPALNTIYLYEIAHRNNHMLLCLPYWAWEDIQHMLKSTYSQTAHLGSLSKEKAADVLALYDPDSTGYLRTLAGAVQALSALP